MDANISAILSLIGGALGIYIILAVCDYIKEFSIKGVGFEFSSILDEKMRDVKQEVKDSKEDVKGRVAELSQSLLAMQNTIVSTTLSANLSQKIVIENYLDTKNRENAAEKAKTISQIDAGTVIKPNRKFNVPKEVRDRLLALEENQKVLEGMYKGLSGVQPPKLDIEQTLKEANVFYYADDYDKSIELNRKIIEIEPRNSQALGHLALSLSKTGKFEEAQEFYRRALEITPGDGFILSNISSNLLRLNRVDEALQYLEKYLASHSQSDEFYSGALYNMACVKSRLRQTSEALDYLKKATRKPDYNNLKEYAKTDEDLANIREMQEFKDIVNS